MEMMKNTKISVVGAVADVADVVFPCPRAGVWCWLIMKWLVWVTAGLSGTRVKTRLISRLEVAYHGWILFFFREQGGGKVKNFG